MIKGYITVFFSISIALCLSLMVGLIYGVRENALRMRVREAFDTTLCSAFAEYNTELWKQYGLVFVDAGYSYEAHSMILPEEHAVYCMQQNFNENGSLINGTDLLRLRCINVETDTVRFATDYGGRAVFNQAVRYMKYHYKLEYIEKLYENARSYEEHEFTEKDLKQRQEEAMAELNNNDSPVLVELKETAEEAITDDKSVGVISTLRLVLPVLADISGVEIPKDNLISKRDLNKGNAKPFSDNYSSTDILFFKEYLMRMCGNYLAPKKDSVMKYETEYLIAGKYSDVENLESVVNRILLIREAANIVALYADQEKQKLVGSIAAVIAVIAGGPEAEPAIRALINCVWAYFESVADVKKLMAGKKVPMIKDANSWESGIGLFGIEGNDLSGDEGLSYSDYLRILLYLGKVDTEIIRFMDVCEMNIRQVLGRKFRLDYCFDYWSITAYVISEYGYEYSITGEKDTEE